LESRIELWERSRAWERWERRSGRNSEVGRRDTKGEVT
jgi:hypothetical protein